MVKLFDEAFSKWFFKAPLQGVVRKGFGGEEIKRNDMKNTVDWIGVNYYTRPVVKHIDQPPYFQGEANYGFICQPASKSAAGRPTSEFGWEIYPEGIGRL